MLETTRLKEQLAEAVKGLQKRGIGDAVDLINQVLELDQTRKDTQGELDQLLAESNQLSRQIGNLMKEGKREEANQVKEQTSALKSKSKELNEQLLKTEEDLRDKLYNLPNIPNKDVPAGQSEEHNQVVYEYGDLPSLSPDAQPHWELIKKYDIIDFDLGNKITGAGFPVYKGKGAKLQRALINFFLDEAEAAGYMEIQPPIVINEASGYGTGQLPDKEGQMYHITEENLFMIPTAEVPLTNIFRDVILKSEELPKKMVGYTPCFRREAGSWGAHVRGLNRLHQFDKVEIVQVSLPDHSYEILDSMSNHIQNLLKKLELPYRVLLLCGGDLGFTSAITYDMEVYSAAQEKWLEVSSVSNFETYQANRLKLRYKDDTQRSRLLHTLNGSALALPRIVASILENNQTEQGILIPKVLQKYTGFDRID